MWLSLLSNRGLRRRQPRSSWLVRLGLAAAGLCLLLGANAAATVIGGEEAAERVLNRYFTALRVGNLDTLRGLLGEELRSKRERLLGNPAYRVDLIQTYSGARFDILNCEALPSGGLSATVDIWRGDDAEPMRHRFFLEESANDGSLRIMSEEFVP